MKDTLPPVLIVFTLACLGGALRAAPPPPGTISDNVGYSRATDFDGSNFQTLTQEYVADNADSVLVLAYLTPW